MVCYDVTSSESFFQVSDQAKMLLELFVKEGENKPMVFVGLKSDLAEQRQVDF